jgi:hypothetical protein
MLKVLNKSSIIHNMQNSSKSRRIFVITVSYGDEIIAYCSPNSKFLYVAGTKDGCNIISHKICDEKSLHNYLMKGNIKNLVLVDIRYRTSANSRYLIDRIPDFVETLYVGKHWTLQHGALSKNSQLKSLYWGNNQQILSPQSGKFSLGNLQLDYFELNDWKTLRVPFLPKTTKIICFGLYVSNKCTYKVPENSTVHIINPDIESNIVTIKGMYKETLSYPDNQESLEVTKIKQCPSHWECPYRRYQTRHIHKNIRDLILPDDDLQCYCYICSKTELSLLRIEDKGIANQEEFYEEFQSCCEH